MLKAFAHAVGISNSAGSLNKIYFYKNVFAYISWLFLDLRKNLDFVAYSATENIPSHMNHYMCWKWFQKKVLSAGECAFVLGQKYSAGHRRVAKPVISFDLKANILKGNY